MKNDRLAVLSAAFRSLPLTIHGLTLRPITSGSLILLIDLGNPLFAETGATVSEAEHMAGLFEFIYVHTAPIEQVITAAQDPQQIRQASQRLAFEIPLEELAAFAEQLATVRERLAAAMVDVLPEPGVGKPEGVPNPISSPPSSIPLAATPPPSPSDGSSGASPSTAPSNISTPPWPQTASAPAGRSPIWEQPAAAPEADPEEDYATPLIPVS